MATPPVIKMFIENKSKLESKWPIRKIYYGHFKFQPTHQPIVFNNIIKLLV